MLSKQHHVPFHINTDLGDNCTKQAKLKQLPWGEVLEWIPHQGPTIHTRYAITLILTDVHILQVSK